MCVVMWISETDSEPKVVTCSSARNIELLHLCSAHFSVEQVNVAFKEMWCYR